MATYETMFLDNYNIEDSTKRISLVGTLRSTAEVPHDELSDSQLSALLWNGALVLNPEIVSWEEIQPVEEWAIVLWAAMGVTDKRMMASAKYFPIDSRVGKTDPSVRVGNNARIKEVLRKQFEDYLNDNGLVVGDPGVVQGEFIRMDLVSDYTIPVGSQPSPPKVALQLLKKTSTSIDLQWTMPKMPDFYAYEVYYDSNPDIEDVTRRNEGTNTGARSDASKAMTIYDQWDRALRITDMTPGAYWFVVSVMDMNGRVTFSNEIQATLS